MSDPSYPAFPLLAFVSFFLVLIPLPWHLQAWNAGTSLFMIWTAIGCLNLFINSLIWHGTAVNYSPIWCDISTRITVAVAVAIPSASLCINRRLYKIVSVQTAGISRAEKRRGVIMDLFIGLGIPLLQMVLQIIVEGHRFNIFEDIGCYPAIFNTPIAYPLSIVWPTVIGVISAVYCLLTLRAFMQRRAQFSEFMNSTSSLTVNRYFRLMALATVELLFDTPISAYGIYLNIVDNPMYPWRGWADAHFEYFAVDQFPAVIWRSNVHTVVSLELSRWSVVFCALLFFGFFGFAEEARRHYRLAFSFVAKHFGVSPASTPNKCIPERKGPSHRLPTSATVGPLPAHSARSLISSSLGSSESPRESSDFSSFYKYPPTSDLKMDATSSTTVSPSTSSSSHLIYDDADILGHTFPSLPV